MGLFRRDPRHRTDRELKKQMEDLAAYGRNFVPSTEWERRAITLGWKPLLGSCQRACGKCPKCLEFAADPEGYTRKWEERQKLRDAP